MRTIRLLTAIAAGFVACTLPTLGHAGVAAEQAAAPLQPTGKWIVDFADARCTASRNYAGPDGQWTMVLKRPPIGDVVQVTVYGMNWRGQPSQYDGQVTLGDGAPLEISAARFTPVGRSRAAVVVSLPLAQLQEARGMRTFRIAAGKLDQTLAISGMDSLVKVLDECVAGLRADWPVQEADAIRLLQTNGKIGLTDLVKNTDYPTDAIENERQGSVTMAILIDQAGKVVDCSVIGSSGVAALDVQSCIVVQRGKFQPILDPQGQPRKVAIEHRLNWSMR